MNTFSQVTLRDVAKAVGVSATTVSLALRNHAKIPIGHRQLIQDTARRMGYRPDPMAAALGYKRGHSLRHPINAELAWINNWQAPRCLRSYKEFDLYWQGATRIAEKHGFRLEEFVVGRELSFGRLESILQCRNIQGILVPPHGGAAVTTLDRASLNWHQYSVVKFGYSIPALPSNVVGSNQTQGAMLAFSEMQKHGYKRIGYICHLFPSTRSRAGFLMAQVDSLPKLRLPILQLDIASGHCLQTFKRWLRMHKPDAILTEIKGTRLLLEEVGLRVPGDIALASMSVLDGDVDAGIYQNSEEIGRIAADTLVRLIYNRKAGLPACNCEILVDGIWQNGNTLPDLVNR